LPDRQTIDTIALIDNFFRTPHLFNARYVLRSGSSAKPISDELRERYIAHVAEIFTQGMQPPSSRRAQRRSSHDDRGVLGTIS
jgi:hypothetical protein